MSLWRTLKHFTLLLEYFLLLLLGTEIYSHPMVPALMLLSKGQVKTGRSFVNVDAIERETERSNRLKMDGLKGVKILKPRGSVQK